MDTHIKNAISKPRTASTLRRMTALVNFDPDLRASREEYSSQITVDTSSFPHILARVISTAEKPELEAAQLERRHREPPIHTRSISVASPVGVNF